MNLHAYPEQETRKTMIIGHKKSLSPCGERPDKFADDFSHCKSPFSISPDQIKRVYFVY